MSTGTGIEWSDATWNPVSGCTRVSAGCDNCYAVKATYRLERMGQTAKYGGLTVLNNRGDRHFNGVVRCHEDALDIPLRWRKPRRVFVNSMSDLFHKDVPFEFIDKVFAVMALCPRHTFQVLTKRPERMAEYFTDRDAQRVVWERALDISPGANISERYDFWEDIEHHWPLPNVWLGTSAENQAEADERRPYLAACPAAVWFLSIEPMLGPVDLVGDGDPAHLPWDWVIVGGESGRGARPCDVKWIKSVVRQCRDAGVACFVKQLGAVAFDTSGPGLRVDDVVAATRVHLRHPKGGDWDEWPAELRVREFPR